MIKRAAVVLAGVLWLAGAASAGCNTWILWGRFSGSALADTWEPARTFTDQAACEQVQRQAQATIKPGAGVVTSWHCFPDTIDPRPQRR
jgi:hypothetical protein